MQLKVTYTVTSYQFYNGHALMANNQTDTPYPDVHKAYPDVHTPYPDVHKTYTLSLLCVTQTVMQTTHPVRSNN